MGKNPFYSRHLNFRRMKRDYVYEIIAGDDQVRELSGGGV